MAKLQHLFSDIKKYYKFAGVLFVVLIFWTSIVGSSLFWNLRELDLAIFSMARERAQAFFKFIESTRVWNAQLGGIYVLVTDKSLPNPYLQDPDRDLTTTTNQHLTKINPAYMTRQIAEIVRERDHVVFHITAEDPIRPANKPDEWEALALEQFKQGIKEKSEFINLEGGTIFRFMAPLPFAEDCAKCHDPQKEAYGFRGGISVTLQEDAVQAFRDSQKKTIIPLHFVVLILGLVIICGLAVFLHRRQSSLKEIAFYDYLTGLANRRLFNNRLNHEIIRAKRNRVMIGVLFLDLDGFKSVNDTIGHEAGDHLLQEVASRLKSAVRQGDTVARVGGDEFVLLISDLSDRDSVNLVVDKIVSVFDWPWIYNDVHYSISASHGLSIFPGDGEDAVTLIGKADSAMYETKKMKKGRDNRSK